MLLAIIDYVKIFIDWYIDWHLDYRIDKIGRENKNRRSCKNER